MGSFPQVFPTKTLNTPLLSTISATCPAHVILLDFITRKILGEYISLSSSLCRFSHTSVASPLLSTMHVTCPVHIIHLDLVIRTILGEEYRSLSSSLCTILHSPVTSTLFGQIFSQHPILKHSQPTFLPQYKRPSFTPIQNNRQNYSSVYLTL